MVLIWCRICSRFLTLLAYHGHVDLALALVAVLILWILWAGTCWDSTILYSIGMIFWYRVSWCVLHLAGKSIPLPHFFKAELLSSLGCGRFSPTHWESAREKNLSASMVVFMDGWRPGPAILGEPSSTKGYWSKADLSKFQRTHANPLHLQDAMKPFKILQGFLN